MSQKLINKSISKTINKIKDDTYDVNNMKRMLCKNVLAYGKCNYGDKCLYSHSLLEQKKDSFRDIIYSYIIAYVKNHKINQFDVSIIHNKDFMRALHQLTKTCQQCEEGVCQGGYNCKFGVFNKLYQVCYDDLYSECTVQKCPYVHTSLMGVKNEKNKSLHNTNFYSKTIQHNKYYKKFEPIVGTLLSPEYFQKQKSNDNHDDQDNQDNQDNDSISNTSYDRINEYLNDLTPDDQYDESIFIFK